MKNLVVCCDGSWNTPDMKDHGLPSPTNVVKLYHALVQDETQLAYYHPGVGTGKSLWDKVSGGGMGEGLDRNIKSAYRWLASHYEPGDCIFIFGFSRGAYTARSLGGLVARIGLLDLTDPALGAEEVWRRVDLVFDGYRTTKPFERPGDFAFNPAEPAKNAPNGPPIHFIGVWDTVGALGIPDDFALLGLLTNPKNYQFHDTMLSPAIQHARHAVAIDEKRASFEPTLWSGDHPDLAQLWFPGCHGDVGGGFYESGLSDGALQWMIAEATAQKCGLKIMPGIDAQIRPDAQAIIHDSFIGLFKSLKSRPRAAPFISGAGDPDLHESTRVRAQTASLVHGAYWSGRRPAVGAKATCNIYAAEHWNATGLFLEAGKTYKMTAAGQWIDDKDSFTPDGKGESGLQLGDIARFAGTMLGEGETLFRNLSGSKAADFLWTRRVETEHWFALIGFIANDQGRTARNLPTGETFLIGKGMTITPKASGYLYGFANDAWQTYENNHGSVSLCVTRTA